MKARELFNAQAGLTVLLTAKKLNGGSRLKITRVLADVKREAEVVRDALRQVELANARTDEEGKAVIDPSMPNAQRLLYEDPLAVEREQRQILDKDVELTVPEITEADLATCELPESDFSGAMLFVLAESAALALEK